MYIATVVYGTMHLHSHCQCTYTHTACIGDVEDVFTGKQGLSVAVYKFLLVLAVKTELAAWWF